MSEKTGIEWTDATRGEINAATKIGCGIAAYLSKQAIGEKWCTKCKAWHPRTSFGADRSRYDGLAACCLESKRVKARKPQSAWKKHGWLTPTRDGDKKQARRRVNYLVEQGRIPHPDDLPCMDCGDMVFTKNHRHEYDHARGYDGDNQLYVEPVCQQCHRNREDARRGQAA